MLEIETFSAFTFKISPRLNLPGGKRKILIAFFVVVQKISLLKKFWAVRNLPHVHEKFKLKTYPFLQVGTFSNTHLKIR